MSFLCFNVDIIEKKEPFFAKRNKNYNIFTLGFGEILKRPTRADCKSADYVFAGSNPALPTLTRKIHTAVWIFLCYKMRVSLLTSVFYNTKK